MGKYFGKKGGTVYGKKKRQNHYNKEIGTGKIRQWSGVDSTLKEITTKLATITKHQVIGKDEVQKNSWNTEVPVFLVLLLYVLRW